MLNERGSLPMYPTYVEVLSLHVWRYAAPLLPFLSSLIFLHNSIDGLASSGIPEIGWCSPLPASLRDDWSLTTTAPTYSLDEAVTVMCFLKVMTFT
ncbi:hypothetical protein IMCC26256_112256 [Actinobacteria bacterium IMCC26256]|nr:hypothetical protein IMCC26256_112256 [Actinobacteria bacterium IMCC26256]